MKDPIYKDEIFIVKQNGENFISSIPNTPSCLRKLFLDNCEFYHSSMEEFEAYRDKFKAVLKYLEKETDEAFHITCLNHKSIEYSCFNLDIRFKETPEELGNLFLFGYRVRKADAIKKIDTFISNNDNLNYKEEEERDKLINKYNLVDIYKDKMTSNFNKTMGSMIEVLGEIKEILKKNLSKKIKHTLLTLLIFSITLFSCYDVGTTSKSLNGNEESLPEELKGLRIYTVTTNNYTDVKVGVMDNTKTTSLTYNEGEHTGNFILIEKDTNKTILVSKIIYENDSVIVCKK